MRSAYITKRLYWFIHNFSQYISRLSAFSPWMRKLQQHYDVKRLIIPWKSFSPTQTVSDSESSWSLDLPYVKLSEDGSADKDAKTFILSIKKYKSLHTDSEFFILRRMVTLKKQIFSKVYISNKLWDPKLKATLTMTLITIARGDLTMVFSPKLVVW